MRRLLLTLAGILLALSAWAAPVSKEQAAKAAHLFWHQTLGKPADITLSDRSSEWDYSAIYLFTAKDRGFVMVAADDNAKTILAYSTDNTIDPAHLPVQLEAWLSAYQQEIVSCRQWKGTKDSSSTTKSLGSYVEPLLSTLWDQYQPYNRLCPAGTVTGCAATAQAQLMKYWNHPAFGKGEHSYVHNQFGTLGADFAHTMYDWDHMPDSADAFNDTPRQLDAVATLMYHVGVSLNMQYASPQNGGSAAAGLAGTPGYASMDNSLKDYFHYSTSMRVISKNHGFSNESWRDTLMAELDRKHPILYTGNSSQGGHGFVCDGYDSLGLMHFNFGWSGEGNGYYAIGAITPGIGPDGSLGDYNFSSNNQALLGAVPVYAMRLSDSVKAFVREGGVDSLLFSINTSLDDTSWTVSCDAPWLDVSHNGFSRTGWIHLSASENNSGAQRVATVTFTQHNEQVLLRVVQDNYALDDYCPLTVIMESRRNNGWLGNARLTLESEGGLVFGTAQLAGGALDSVVIPVSPLPLHVVWHSGGGTDRFANYTIKGPAGNELLHVENAYLSENSFIIDNPCFPLAIQFIAQQGSGILLYPNPVGTHLTVSAETAIRHISIHDMTGRMVYDSGSLAPSCRHTVPTAHLSSGVYILRALTDHGMAINRMVKE
ncbi:MAG: C10 family peptidase [Bacteroidales bacterium]|nr:C10 family peptidase [Bacteroidales bacterium]